MSSRRPISSRQLLIGFAAALVLLAANAAVSLRAIDRLEVHQERIAHTLRVKGELRVLMVNLLRLESAQRGFILTERPVFRETMPSARTEAESSLVRLRSLVRGNPTQSTDMDRLSRYVDDRVRQIDRVFEAYRQDGRAGALDLMSTERGKMLMDSVSAISERMERREDRLLAQRQQTAIEAQSDLSATVGIASALALALVFGLYLLIRSDLRRRESEARYIRTLNEQLDARVTERTRDLAAANATLNETITQLGRSNRELQDFAFVASHDLQEPLRKIRTFADLLREEHGADLAPEAKHCRRGRRSRARW